MLRNLKFLVAFFILLTAGFSVADGQTTSAEKPTRPVRRTGVKIAEIAGQKTAEKPAEKSVEKSVEKTDNKATVTETTNPTADTPVQKALIKSVEQRTAARVRAETEQRMKAEAEQREAELAEQQKLETERRETELKAQAEQREAELKAENERREIELKAENERRETELKAENERRETELKAEAERRETAIKENVDSKIRTQIAEAERINAEKLEAEQVKNAALLEAERIANAEKSEAERVERERLETEKLRLETEKLRLEKETAGREEKLAAERESYRRDLVVQTAKSLKFIKPETALELVPPTVQTAEEIFAYLQAASKADPGLAVAQTFCDTSFKGALYTDDTPHDITLGTMLNTLKYYYDINFIPDPEVLELVVHPNAEDVPWNIVLRQQLDYLDLVARCVDAKTISILKRSKAQTIKDAERQSAPLITEFIKLNNLRPTSGGAVNLAGRSQGGKGSFETLEATINTILRAGGETRGAIAQIPGRPEFFIRATREQIDEIKAVIARADKPVYRVDIFAMVYTINETKLKDVGSQLSAVINARGGARVGGFSTLPNGGSTSDDTGTSNTSSINGLPPGFSQPNGLGAGAPNSIFAARAQLGVAEFAYQLSLLEQLGVARRIERPFLSAKDGTTGVFENGTQIPVVISSLNNFGTGGGGQIDFINAGTTLSATPQIIEDTVTGKPKLVNLTLRLESNTPDLSIQTTGNVPSVNSRRIQNEITIAPNQVFIFGGSNDKVDSNNVSRTPGLGELPIIGNLFKRKTKQITDNKLFFAVWVRIALDDADPAIPSDTLPTVIEPPPSPSVPLTIPKKNN